MEYEVESMRTWEKGEYVLRRTLQLLGVMLDAARDDVGCGER